MSQDQLFVPLHMGLIPLYHLDETRKMNEWIFRVINPFLKGSILEIGSGNSHITNLFIKSGLSVYLSDPDGRLCTRLSEEFTGERLVRNIFRIDLKHPDFEHKYADLFGKFSTVVLLTRMTNTPIDKLVIANAKNLLRTRGHLVVQTPVHMALYNGIRQGLEHWRGYNYRHLQKLFGKDTEILKTRYFNMVGITGWWLSGSVFKKKRLSEEFLDEYDTTVPVFRVSEDIAFNQIGLSVIAIVRKN